MLLCPMFFFPFMARINPQACCDYFHPIPGKLQILSQSNASRTCKLVSGFCHEWKRGFNARQSYISGESATTQ